MLIGACPHCQQSIEVPEATSTTSMSCPACQNSFSVAGPPPRKHGWIPAKNPCALIGYYFGVASFIPGIGFVTGLPAIILGIIGGFKSRCNPEVGGEHHATVAILGGLIGPFAWIALLFILYLIV